MTSELVGEEDESEGEWLLKPKLRFVKERYLLPPRALGQENKSLYTIMKG